MSHSRQASISSSVTSSSRHNHPLKIGPWKLGKTLGRGATGRVLLATHHRTGQRAAVKVVSKSELHDDDGGHKTSDDTGLPYGIEREIIIMKLLTHPNVLRLYDVWETSKALYLVLEYVEGGELFDLLVERGPLQEAEAIKYFRQIILGTAYCHALGICHRDLKPENLLLDAALNVKLADFGMAALESGDKLLETSCGSPHYAAPEIVSGLKYHGAASDVWSCGVILFALLTGRLPFDDENIRNLLLKVQAGNFEMPHDISPEARNLIDLMLTVDPMERIPTDKILNHPLLLKYPIPNEDLISVKSLPHPETAYKSLGSEKNIDKQILSNLSILWHDRPEHDIVRALLRNGPNPEKTFYALLLRYRHNQDSGSTYNSPKKSASFNSKRAITNSSSTSTKNTPKKKRNSQIVASRPSSFQYKNGSSGSNNRASLIGNSGRMSSTPSAQNSPRKSPGRYAQSPRKSPVKSPRKSAGKPHYDRESPPPAIPRNIYNEIVSAQNNAEANTPQKAVSTQSIAPTLPSKDSYLLENANVHNYQYNFDNINAPPNKLHLQPQPNLQPTPSGANKLIPSDINRPPPPPPHGQVQQLQASPNVGKANPIVDEVSSQNLMASAMPSNSGTSKSPSKRLSMIKNSTSKNRLSRRKSLRASMTSGLKRNSITMKLLSTYAKLSGETDWEYMDKLTKRTSATFALLCDKIFNQEEYDEDEENLVDEEEKQAREYERLMEIERKKHEAEMIARKELEKRRKRQKRRSLLSSKKLSVLIKDDNNSELDLLAEESTEIEQPKRKSAGLRSLSEGRAEKVTEKVEPVQKRSVTEPRQRLNPIVTRRPVSRLDPLWTAYENEQLTRAKDALDAELRETRRKKSQRKSNRESMVHREARYSSASHPESAYADYSGSARNERANQYKRVSQYRDSRIIDDYADNTDSILDERRMSRNSYYDRDSRYNIPEPDIEDSDLSEEYMSEIRKSRLLNSQLNIHDTIAEDPEASPVPKTLISNVKIPTVTRKSRHFSLSNKRLSVLSMYSTKESYRDLNHILADGKATGKYDSSVLNSSKPLRTSLADRLEYGTADVSDREDEEPLDHGSVMEEVPRKLGDYDMDETFVTKNDQVRRKSQNRGSNHQQSKSGGTTLEDDSDVSGANVFDNIKLPDGKSSKSSIDAISEGSGTRKNGSSQPPQPPQHRNTHKSMLPSAQSMLIPNLDNKKEPQTYSKVRQEKPAPPAPASQKQPLEDTTNKETVKSKGSIFRKLSWGAKKTLDDKTSKVPNASTQTAFAGGASTKNQPEPRPQEKQKSGFLKWFTSSSSNSEQTLDSEIKRFNTILPKHEMSTALFALLSSWSNFGLKNLRNDQVLYNITGAISSNNAFNLKSCKFRIKISSREMNQKSLVVCARVKGSKVSTDTLFKEIEKVLTKEGVMDS